MQTIAIFNTQGGSGKSAATVFLATKFSKRVLVVDLDPQTSSSVESGSGKGSPRENRFPY